MVRKTENLRQCYPEILMPTMGASNSTSMPAKCQKKTLKPGIIFTRYGVVTM